MNEALVGDGLCGSGRRWRYGLWVPERIVLDCDDLTIELRPTRITALAKE